MTNYLLFSAELLLDTRLSQQPAGGVLKYFEDWLAGVQRSSRQKKPLKSSTILNAFIQNKPNFRCFCAKNHDSTQKQTQTNPIQTHFYPQKPTPKPKQTQPACPCMPQAGVPAKAGIQSPFLLVKLPKKSACRITKFRKAKKYESQIDKQKPANTPYHKLYLSIENHLKKIMMSLL